jgi:hypothetical protein
MDQSSTPSPTPTPSTVPPILSSASSFATPTASVCPYYKYPSDQTRTLFPSMEQLTGLRGRTKTFCTDDKTLINCSSQVNEADNIVLPVPIHYGIRAFCVAACKADSICMGPWFEDDYHQRCHLYSPIGSVQAVSNDGFYLFRKLCT